MKIKTVLPECCKGQSYTAAGILCCSNSVFRWRDRFPTCRVVVLANKIALIVETDKVYLFDAKDWAKDAFVNTGEDLTLTFTNGSK